MFNFLKKKSAINVFFSRLSPDEKESIIALLALVAAIDRDNDAQKTEFAYLEFYCQHLKVDVKKLTKDALRKSLSDLIQPLTKCTEPEKAALIFIFRGMANIDKEANKQEVEMLDMISKRLDFDLEKFILQSSNESDLTKVTILFREIIFPNGIKNLDQEAGILNHLTTTKMSIDKAKQIYITLALGYEMTKIRSIKHLEDQLDSFDVDITDENIDKLYKFLRGSIIARLNDAINTK